MRSSALAALGVVQWSIERRQIQPAGGSLSKRAANTFEEVITNEKTRGGYFTTCTVGSPPQNLTMQLDTGSSDVWVPSSKAPICTRKQDKSNPGCTFGTFDSAQSSTFAMVGADQFRITYVDGSGSKGDYFMDSFEIGGANLINMTMGLGRQTDIPYGLVGVGYASNEAIVASTQSLNASYPNLPLHMMEEGLIKTNAYSLWLNDLSSDKGNILFGGIDTKKYEGDLTRIKIYPDAKSNAYTSFKVALTSLEATSPSGKDTLTSPLFPIPVVLDSGTTLSYLPNDLAIQVWNEVGAVFSSEIGMAVLPCNMASSLGNFTFGFAGQYGPRIHVAMDELVLDLTNGEAPTFVSGQYKGLKACEFGIQNFSSDPFLLGDTFLRSAYVVYDLVNNEIGLASTDFNATESNIIPFPSAGAPIPSATVAPGQDTLTQTVAGTKAASSPVYAAAPGFQIGVMEDRKNGAPGLVALPVVNIGVMAVWWIVDALW